MRTAIVYASTHGTTEWVAQRLREEMGGDTDLMNLKSTKGIDLSQYQRVMIGGSIHAGRMQGRVKVFCRKNMVDLLGKRIGLFMCGMNEKDYEQEFTDAFPELLRNHAASSKVIGGEFKFERMNFIERLIVRKVTGISQNVSRIDEKKITELANEIKNNEEG